MNKMEDLRAGVAEMRSVAQRLNRWADDLEASFQDRKAPEEEAETGKPAMAEPEIETAAGRTAVESAATEEAGKTFTLPEVRAVLAEKCAAGFSTQVKALIESYGASSLKGVPAEKYGELLEAVKELGDTDAG